MYFWMMTPTVPMCCKHGNKYESKNLCLMVQDTIALGFPRPFFQLSSQKEKYHNFKQKNQIKYSERVSLTKGWHFGN